MRIEIFLQTMWCNEFIHDVFVLVQAESSLKKDEERGLSYPKL